MKRDTDNWARALETMKGLLHCRKISWTLVDKRLRTVPEFLPTLTISFCHSPSHTIYAALTWRPTATLDETAIGSSAAQIWSPKRCYVGNAIVSGGLKWQYIAIIATFSSSQQFCSDVSICSCVESSTWFERETAWPILMKFGRQDQPRL